MSCSTPSLSPPLVFEPPHRSGTSLPVKLHSDCGCKFWFQMHSDCFNFQTCWFCPYTLAFRGEIKLVIHISVSNKLCCTWHLSICKLTLPVSLWLSRISFLLLHQKGKGKLCYQPTLLRHRWLWRYCMVSLMNTMLIINMLLILWVCCRVWCMLLIVDFPSRNVIIRYFSFLFLWQIVHYFFATWL